MKQCIQLIKELTENEEDYKKFYDNFSKNLKLGIVEDQANRKKLVEFLRFQTSKSGEEKISLREYLERMKKDQKEMYVIAGESMKVVQNSPFIEQLKKRDLEVIFMTDPIDEYIL